ncbi:alpha/beta-hydrolase, partial [Stipitochalara longipes BDJ]
TVSAQVKTSSGIVSGHAASNATGVSEYLGIPFAQPPIGNLRFQPPVALSSPDSIVNGSSFGFACMSSNALQLPIGNVAGANLTAAGLADILPDNEVGDTFSEDCLTLNVWVPSGGEEKKAVLVWLYGGTFLTGASSESLFNGQNIAGQEDVIVVSINYRTTIFGFPGNPALANLNVGILDQRLGFEWIRDNIQAFGGDPTRITGFGQSAGAASLDFYSFAYETDPVLSGIILESGTIQLIAPLPSNTASWFGAASLAGCGNSSSNSTAVASCMQTVSVTALNKAAALVQGSWGPIVDNITIFSDYSTRIRGGKFSQIPILIGNNDDEATLFLVQQELKNATLPEKVSDGNLQSFTCPAGARANASVAANLATWRYRYFGDFPNTMLTSSPDSGAWHGSEVPVIFDTLPQPGNGIPASTSAEVAIGKYIRGAWAAFAKNSTGGLLTYEEGWPMYQPGGETLIRLAYNNLTGTN